MSQALSDKARQAGTNFLHSMRNVWTITAKELTSFFCTSIGYTVILGYVLTTSLFFILILDILRRLGKIPPTGRPLTVFYQDYMILFIFMFLSSILAMRLFAHEKETGTIEMLLTVPVADWEVVIGKYAATVIFYLICISPSLINALVLFRPGIASGVLPNILLPTLIVLPALLVGYFVLRWLLENVVHMSSQKDIIAVIILMVITLVVAAGLRGTGMDCITQRTAFIPDDQVDFDNDGMPDAWERRHGLDPTKADATDDADGDLDANEVECLFDTDPLDPESNTASLIYDQVPPAYELTKGDEDLDGDHLPDKWEQFHGLSPENGQDALEDNDGDGASNLREWQYDTRMNDRSDHPRARYVRYLTQVNTIDRNHIDGDNDGMPDEWEESYGISIQEDNAGVDLDNDGYSNIDEYHYKTDPSDKASLPRLPESLAWFLHFLSYILAVGLFLFVAHAYSPKQEARTALFLKYTGMGGIAGTILLTAIFIFIPNQAKGEALYSGFLFWGFILFFITITAILSRLALLSRSQLNAAAVSVFLFLIFRLFWNFSIAEKAISPPDVGITFAGYAGGLLVGAFFIAIGIFFSSLFRNQVNAAVVTFATLIMLFMAQFIPRIKGEWEIFQPVFNHFSFVKTLVYFSEGNIRFGNLTFFLSGIALFLFLTVKVLGIRKWR